MNLKLIEDKKEWESFLTNCKGVTFLQSFYWGEFHKEMGGKVWRCGFYDERGLKGVAQILKIEAKRGVFLLVPHGPVLAKESLALKEKLLAKLLNYLKSIAKTERADFIRIAPIFERTKENAQIFEKLGFLQAPIFLHPEVTWELDLNLSEEDLLFQMRKTTRYLIRKSLNLKDLKVIKKTDREGFEIFWNLYFQTAKDQHFSPFSKLYLEKELEVFKKENLVEIFLAFYQEEPVAGAFIIFWNNAAFYHHGASLKKYRQVPASYLVQWQAFLEAKRRGCLFYNFWGIAEGAFNFKNSSFNKKEHRFAGITLFKTGFGGYKKEYLQTQDFVLTLKYWLNFLVEIIRRYLRNL
jgi:peptidoglycan pentaglycine glycine transferase (the first glycine)